MTASSRSPPTTTVRAHQKQLGAWLVVIRASRPEDASFVADNSFIFVAAQPRVAAALVMISGSLKARKEKRKKSLYKGN